MATVAVVGAGSGRWQWALALALGKARYLKVPTYLRYLSPVGRSVVGGRWSGRQMFRFVCPQEERPVMGHGMTRSPRTIVDHDPSTAGAS